MILLLDTSDREQASLYLLRPDGVRTHHWRSISGLSLTLHAEISKFLKKNRVKLSGLKKIAVVSGPGHFSGLRSGIVTANALGYALGLPVVGIKKLGIGLNFSAVRKLKGKAFADPFYGKPPNITKPKRKK